MTAGPLEQVLRHDRLFLATGLGMVIALAWGWLLAGAGMSANGIDMTRMSFGALSDAGAAMDMNMTVFIEWSWPFILVMFFMWWIMMVAMMLPGAAPMILMAASINRKADPARPPYGTTSAFMFGYLLGWGLFSAAAVAAQWSLANSGLLSDMLVLNSSTLSAGILIVAGFWQFTSWKNSCLQHCRSPVHFLTQNRRPDNTGALVMGVHHSLYCVGCCWFLMLLLFVGGIMNLIWIAALTLYVWLEKAAPGGQRMSQIAGAGLILAGLFLLQT
jgi:predicted metal-binding membrane protein